MSDEMNWMRRKFLQVSSLLGAGFLLGDAASAQHEHHQAPKTEAPKTEAPKTEAPKTDKKSGKAASPERVRQKTPEQVRDSVEQVKAALKADASIARYAERSTLEHVEKVYEEMTGKKLPAAQKASRQARDLHAVAHGRRSDFVMRERHHHGHS